MTPFSDSREPSPDPWLERLADARVWRWRTSVGLPVERTADVAQAVWAALNETARRMFGSNRLPPDLHPTPGDGRDGPERHDHAFVLPEDLDQDGLIDSVAVMQAANVGGGGFTRKGLTLLSACPGFWLGEADVELLPAWLGPVCPFGFDAPARRWRSMTPFASPRHRLGPDRQIAESLARLGLPVPIAIDCLGDAIAPPDRDEIAARAFAPIGPAASRWTGALAARAGDMAFWSLTFDQPAPGPILIGGLSHFGLGRFAPVFEG